MKMLKGLLADSIKSPISARGGRCMRSVLVVLLTLAAAPVWAKWVKYGEDFIGLYYYDPASITTKSNLVRVNMIQDVTKSAFSRRAVWELDCKERRFHVLSASQYSEPMGKGKIQSTDNTPMKWIAIPPDSPPENMRKIVCG